MLEHASGHSVLYFHNLYERSYQSFELVGGSLDRHVVSLAEQQEAPKFNIITMLRDLFLVYRDTTDYVDRLIEQMEPEMAQRLKEFDQAKGPGRVCGGACGVRVGRIKRDSRTG